MSDPNLITRSISRIVRDVIDDDLAIQDAIFRGYANISAISRIISPKVNERAGRNASQEAIMTALKRISPSYQELSPMISNVMAKSIVNVRTNVAKISVEKSRKNVETIRKMPVITEEDLLQVSEGISAITMIYDQSNRDNILRHFSRNDILEDEVNLAAIIVHSPREVIKTIGCAFAFYAQLSRRRINIEDTVSSFTDTVIVVKVDEVGRAFSALTDLLGSSRKSMGVKSRSSRPRRVLQSR